MDYPSVIHPGICKDCGDPYTGGCRGRCATCHSTREARTDRLIRDMRLYWNCKTVQEVEVMRKAQQ